MANAQLPSSITMETTSTKTTIPLKLFMCHQLAMKKEAAENDNKLRRSNNTVVVTVPIIWVLGGPGCGKGTQCAKIVEKYGFVHLSSGDLLRAEVNSGSEKGKILADIMKEGKLVSNDDVLELLSKAIQSNLNGAKGFLIDGYPRESQQGTAFEKNICTVDLILFFNCSDSTLIKRLMGRAAAAVEKRADDNEETIRTRLATFRENTNGILCQYTNKTVKINAERPVDEIFADVISVLDCLLQKKASNAKQA